ncbi:MAG: aminopeptidase, partial [Cyclobacteriaceae bacterium]|nr:aminopeptidase [Cyclobacteriaceae bacterium]
ANQIGEVAIGTNWAHQTFVKQILFDEKIGGTVHIALGRGYPQTGSIAMSSLHWDILCDMHDEGKIYADGKIIYDKGQFLI